MKLIKILMILSIFLILGVSGVNATLEFNSFEGIEDNNFYKENINNISYSIVDHDVLNQEFSLTFDDFTSNNLELIDNKIKLYKDTGIFNNPKWGDISSYASCSGSYCSNDDVIRYTGDTAHPEFCSLLGRSYISFSKSYMNIAARDSIMHTSHSGWESVGSSTTKYNREVYTQIKCSSTNQYSTSGDLVKSVTTTKDYNKITIENNITLNGQTIDTKLIYNSQEYSFNNGVLDLFIPGGSDVIIKYDFGGTTSSTPELDNNINLKFENTNEQTIIDTYYILDNQNKVLIKENSFTGAFDLNSLTEGNHTIKLRSEKDSIFTESNTINFVVDSTEPQVSINSILQVNSYSVTWSNVFNYHDVNFQSCEVKAENLTHNCDSYIFQENGNHTIEAIVKDKAGNIATESFILLVDPFQKIRFETPAGFSINNFKLNGIEYQEIATIPIYDLGIGNHSLEFLKYGYKKMNISLDFTKTSNINKTEIAQVSLMQIKFRDRNTKELITDQVEMDLVGDNFAKHYSTNSGEIITEDIKELPGLYRLSLSSQGRADNEYYFQHTGFSIVNITSYLINTSETIPIKVILRDIFSNPMKWTDKNNNEQGCIVKVKQHFVDTNDYIAIDMGKTNSNGEIIFDLQYGKYYQFVMDCGGQIDTEPGQKITSTPLYLEFNADERLQVFDKLPNIASDIDFHNLTNTTGFFRFEYNDQNNIATKGCLKVFEQSFLGDQLIDQSCESSASATININLNITKNKKYVAKGYVTYHDKEHFVKSDDKSFFPGDDSWGNGIGLWGSGLIVATLFLIGMAMHPVAAVLLAWLGLFVLVKMKALAISEGSIIGIGAIILGVIIFARKDK